MDNVKDYLEKLEIKNIRLEKQLKEVQVSKVIYFKEDRVIYMYLISKEIISHEILDLLREELLCKLKYFKNIRIKIKFTGFGRKSEKDIIKAYWHNIIYILKNICPAIEGWNKQIEYMCLDNMLKIKIPKDIFYEKLKKNNIEEVIRNILLEELGIDYEVKVEKAIGEKVSDILGIANSSMANIKVGTSVDSLMPENPINKYQLDFNAQFSALSDGFENLIALVGEYLPNIASGMDRQLVIDGSSLAVGISRQIDNQLGRMAIAKGRGNA